MGGTADELIRARAAIITPGHSAGFFCAYEKTFSQKMAEAEEIKAIESERAKARQGARNDLNIVENLPQSEPVKTRDRVAEHLGVSGRTYAGAEKTAPAEAGNELIPPSGKNPKSSYKVVT